MPRSPSTYSLPPGTTPQQPNTVISSSMFNAFADDVAQTFNTVQPIVYGGTGSNDLKLTDTDFGIKDNGDPTKIGQFNASGLPTATTRTYDLPYYSGTLGLVSDIRGQIYGLTLSNNVTDPTNDIDIAAGSAVDNGGVVSMVLSSALGKQLDVAWAVGGTPGSPQGMRASGAAIANTTYHIFLIRRPDTGVVDVAADTSATGANIAANTNAAYTQIRRIGSIRRDAGTIRAFVQTGDEFLLFSPVLDITAVNPGTSDVLRALTVPSGISVTATMTVALNNSGAGGLFGAVVSSPAVSGTDASIGYARNASGGNSDIGGAIQARTDTSSRVRTRATFSDASCTLYIITRGWIDTRGAV